MAIDALLSALVLIPWLPAFALSALCTCVHTADEAVGGSETFWEYVAPLTGWHPTRGVGLAAFGLLAGALIVLAAVGYGGSAWALSLLLGLRFGDFLGSHGLLGLILPGPNPGRATAPLYAAEVAAISGLWPEFVSDPPDPYWMTVGIVVFLLPWIVLGLLRGSQRAV